MTCTYVKLLLQTYANIILALLWVLLTVSLFVTAANAQERQVGGGVIYSHGTGTGNRDGIGGRGDVVIPLNHFLTAVGETSWIIEPKAYLGNDNTNAVRVRADLRAGLPLWLSFTPFVSVGGSAVHQRTSLYTKTAFNPTFGAGVNFKNRVVPFWRHYVIERQTQNAASADELAAEVYLPLGQRWLIRTGAAAINSRFTQPPGHPNTGRHSVWTMTMHLGVAYKF